MLTPYIIEKDSIRFVGKCVKGENSDEVQDKIGSLFEQMNEMFSLIENIVDEKFYGISANYVNSSTAGMRTYWLCKEVYSLKNENGDWIELKSGMESIIIPQSRWLYIPVRYDDVFVKSLAPSEYSEDYSYLTVCVFTWARKWLKEKGYEEQDFPYEFEIYGLHEGYGDLGANLTLAIPIK